nr:hypothetical protein Itr_chr14CG12140 [Ipomoea trifida]
MGSARTSSHRPLFNNGNGFDIPSPSQIAFITNGSGGTPQPTQLRRCKRSSHSLPCSFMATADEGRRKKTMRSDLC